MDIASAHWMTEQVRGITPRRNGAALCRAVVKVVVVEWIDLGVSPTVTLDGCVRSGGGGR